VNRSAELVPLVPPAVVTVTSTVPVPVGTVALIVAELSTTKLAVVAPNFTAEAPVKFVPETVTRLPTGPDVAVTDVTVGGGVM
jgi:hypothetical protein